MPPAEPQPEPSSDRLVRFRQLMAQLDPAGDPARAFAADLYLPSTRAVSTRIAARLELSPASSHFLVGGVGSGKTTELFETRRRLEQLADTRALYIDVTKAHDVERLLPGVVILQVALRIAKELSSLEASSLEVSKITDELEKLAHGYVVKRSKDITPVAPEDYYVAGLLVPPERALESELSRSVLKIRAKIVELRKLLPWHIVILIDGLDRITDMSAFEGIVLNDMKVLTAERIGVVLVGPLKSLYGVDRTIAQHFDELQYQPWIDPRSDQENRSFLTNVLRRRLAESALDEAALEALTRASGGVLRDLIALAQSACVEAYMSGSEVIGLEHARAAIDSFGRKHMQGLRTEELEVLQRVRAKGTFVQTSENDLALLMTRRVLEYRSNGIPRYVVHPTIEPFLLEIAGEAG